MSTSKQAVARRNNTVKVYVSDAEQEILKEQAELANLTITEYCRRRIFGKKITPLLPQTDREAIATMRQLGGLIKQMYKAGAEHSATYPVLKKLESAVDKIWKNAGGEA